MFLARRLVSKKKRRYNEHGFDLDLAYITPRIIAMGYPAEGREGLYRNPASEVVRFLDKMHGENYVVYNLCSEREYSPSMFHGRARRVPFGDHQPPTLAQMLATCEEVAKWMAESPANTFVAHCKAGKGRTGVMICAHLMHTGQYPDPDEAMKYYAQQRTKDGKGVTIPSQQRFLRYFAHVLANGMPEPRPMLLSQLLLGNITEDLFAPVIVIWQRDDVTGELAQVLCTSARACERGAHVGEIIRQKNGTLLVSTKARLVLEGSIKIQLFDKKIDKKASLFYCWVHTSFAPELGTFRLRRDELDKLPKAWSAGLSLEIALRKVDGSVASPAAATASGARPAALTVPDRPTGPTDVDVSSATEINSSQWGMSELDSTHVASPSPADPRKGTLARQVSCLGCLWAREESTAKEEAAAAAAEVEVY